MASYRIGIGSFNLKDGAVGIGTESTGLGNLKVEGTIKTTDLDVGISTFTRYSGFEAEQTNIIRDASYGGNEPVTYSVTVIGGIFYIDGVSAPILTLKRGVTYTFDQSADTNNGHPLRFKDGDGNTYSLGVVATGTPGSLEAKVTFVVPSNAPDDLRYYCTVHGNGMGNTISVINRTSSNLETTGDIVVETGNTLTVGSGATACVGAVESMSVKHHFSVPVGDTAGRNKSSGYAEGTVRYNRDLGTVEFFNGNEWRQFTYISDAQRSPSNRGRGVFGGASGGGSYQIDYLNIASTGNTLFFGSLSTASGGSGDCAGNETRGIFSGNGPNYRAMQYITFASEGRSVAFGDATTNTSPNASTRVCEANSTRFLNMGDYVWTNVIDYVEINTVGNATDFGDLTQKRAQGTGFSSPTRAMYCGGYRQTSPGGNFTVADIDVVKFASLGNATDFGSLSEQKKTNGGGTSNGIRGIIGGGTDSSYVDTIEYITHASEGNGTEFGSLTTPYGYGGAVANQTRAVFRGGERYIGGSNVTSNIIDYIQIATGGNAQDFGDVTLYEFQNGMSDSHGGLGGY